MPMSLTQSQIENKLTNEDLDELLHLWWTEQGAEKRRDLDLMATVMPFPQDATLRVLDLCSGPGDVGRAIRARYPNSQIDCVDRDVFSDLDVHQDKSARGSSRTELCSRSAGL